MVLIQGTLNSLSCVKVPSLGSRAREHSRSATASIRKSHLPSFTSGRSAAHSPIAIVVPLADSPTTVEHDFSSLGGFDGQAGIFRSEVDRLINVILARLKFDSSQLTSSLLP